MSGDKGISAFPNGDDFFSWVGTIHGPPGTVIYQERLSCSQDFNCLFVNLCLQFLCLWRFMKVLTTSSAFTSPMVTHLQPRLSSLSLLVSTPMWMPMETFAWIFLKISGPLFMMFVPSCCRSRVCWEILTMKVPSTVRLRSCGLTRWHSRKCCTTSTGKKANNSFCVSKIPVDIPLLQIPIDCIISCSPSHTPHNFLQKIYLHSLIPKAALHAKLNWHSLSKYPTLSSR